MDCDTDRGSTGAPLANLQRVFEGMAQGLRTMSALLPKADIRRGNRDVRFVPKADIGSDYSTTPLSFLVEQSKIIVRGRQVLCVSHYL
jgi:hypothetical protein